MKNWRKLVGGFSLVCAGLLLVPMAGATTIPAGWHCTGTCGTSGANGVVTTPPNGKSSYQWVSSAGGQYGAGVLPTGKLGKETNGSTMSTSVFSAHAGTKLDFQFNFVTSDGADNETVYSDYAWAALFDASGTLKSVLFTARTSPQGSIVPGHGMPAPTATLDPSSVPIQPGAPDWAPLGSNWNDTCYGGGCGFTGWVGADYTIADAGDYYLQIGVVNWADQEYDTGMAMSGVMVGGIPLETPEPAELGIFGLGLLLVGGFVGLRRRRLSR